MAAEIKVDCNAKQITITWNAIAPATATAAEINAIVSAVEAAFNPGLKGMNSLKFGSCDVTVKANVIKAGAKKAGVVYDTIVFNPAFADDHGETVGPEGDPLAAHATTVSSSSIVIQHEVGHDLGLSDTPGLPGQPKTNWDHNGVTNAHIRQIIWNAKGWDIKAACCDPLADYYMDHEVAVKVTPHLILDDPKKKRVDVKAFSTDHKISRIQVWDCHGQSALDDTAPHDQSASSDFKDPHGNEIKGRNPHEAKATEFTLANDRFPICVDVYEAASDVEPADGHRHGWFGTDGKPIAEKGHPLNKRRQTKLTEGFYPAFDGEVQHGDSFKAPARWEAPPK